MQLLLFGEPQLIAAEGLVRPDRRKALALLAYLARAEQRQSRDRLCTLLWPELDQAHARAALRSTIHALTMLAPGGWLEVQRGTLALDRQAIDVDVERFLSCLRRSQAHTHEQRSLCAECVGWLDEAISYYRADFMDGFAVADCAEYEEWQLVEREWLRREYAYSLARLAAFWYAQQQFDKALGYAQRWLGLDRLHEPAQRLLMQIYAASGQRSEAIRQYHTCVELLQHELAIVPEEETTSLYERIRAERQPAQGEPDRLERSAVHVLPPLPALIIGREQALGDLTHMLGAASAAPAALTVVQGWPGVGKSTIVAALAREGAVTACFPDGVLWTSLGEQPNLLAELRLWAAALRLTAPSQEYHLEQLSAMLSAALRERRMLLIVDDVWQTEHFSPFNVGGHSCAAVITSRLNQVAEALAPTPDRLYRLAVLADDAALELLGRLAPETVAAYPQAARELVHDLEGLPLAIQVAGRLLHNEARLGWGVAELLAELRAGTRLLQAQVPGDLTRPGQAQAPTIAALLKRSTDALDPQTRHAFAVLGLFMPKPATVDLGALAAAWDVADPRPMVRTLVSRGLLEPIGGRRFQLHALLVLHARTLLEG